MSAGLESLFRAYLHQDYDLQHRSIGAAIRAFAVDASAPARRRTLAEIDMLLSQSTSDEDLHLALRQRGFTFFPPRDGETTAAWLRRARAILADVEDAEENGDGECAERDPG